MSDFESSDNGQFVHEYSEPDEDDSQVFFHESETDVIEEKKNIQKNLHQVNMSLYNNVPPPRKIYEETPQEKCRLFAFTGILMALFILGIVLIETKTISI